MNRFEVVSEYTPSGDQPEAIEALARGVEMEAYSVEDQGRGVCFHVYCYNVQPGVEIDYATGENWEA